MAASTSESACPQSDEKTTSLGEFDVDEITKNVFGNVMKCVKSANGLPSGQDYDYYSSFQKMKDVLDYEGNRLLQNVQNIMKFHGAKGNLLNTLENPNVEDKFDILVDANDQLLEGIGIHLDEAAGLKNDKSTVVVSVTSSPRHHISGSWNKITDNSSPTTAKLLTARNITRPQLQFREKVDNGNRPFVPLIKFKPNAKISLEDSLRLPNDDCENQRYRTPHPYKYELDHLEYTDYQLEFREPQKPLILSETPYTFVETEEQVVEMISALRREKEIALDVEAHSFRTFLGLTCLVQISTRSHDYIVDTLKLRCDLQDLNIVLSDPNIVKVFHGADYDIEWLQRDLGLYVVNMFDTFPASKQLGLARYSLAFLLKHYCQVEANKQYQLADWRIRPLPSGLIKYAREDSHYLLYIYDIMRNELLSRGNENKNLLLSVLDKSRNVCGKTYEKPLFDENSYKTLYTKSTKTFNNRQLAALKGLYGWRDGIARIEDESVGYVLPNHMLLQIAEYLPKEAQGILACCNPMPPLVRQNLMDLYKIVSDARKLEKVDRPETNAPVISDQPKYQEYDNATCCPHDLSDERETPLKDLETPFTVEDAVRKLSGCLSSLSSQTPTSDIKKIRETFVSPFYMFLPKPVVTVVRPKDTIVWKLKEATKPTENDQEIAKTQELPIKDPVLPTDVIPLSYQLKKKRKKKITDKETTEEEKDADGDKKISKKKKLTYADVEKANMTPVDYVRNAKLRQSPESQSTSNDFNPNKSVDFTPTVGKQGKRSLHRSRGKKSITYSANKKNS
ncbi:DgyrCDS4582 [Dimorphilus gyrociliatus]|uniref:Exosome complex component 10 homolog n=1 Tax=Dimorphilus gyrociliatus TaxID=2664684 RepID=A0A7I8VIU7_9ANNE|nr:DgyrCDS4582 [Dimorphilus gyrociliatus]